MDIRPPDFAQLQINRRVCWELLFAGHLLMYLLDQCGVGIDRSWLPAIFRKLRHELLDGYFIDFIPSCNTLGLAIVLPMLQLLAIPLQGLGPNVPDLTVGFANPQVPIIPILDGKAFLLNEEQSGA